MKVLGRLTQPRKILPDLLREMYLRPDQVKKLLESRKKCRRFRIKSPSGIIWLILSMNQCIILTKTLPRPIPKDTPTNSTRSSSSSSLMPSKIQRAISFWSKQKVTPPKSSNFLREIRSKEMVKLLDSETIRSKILAEISKPYDLGTSDMLDLRSLVVSLMVLELLEGQSKA